MIVEMTQELRLRRLRVVTGAFALFTAFAFVLGDEVVASIAVITNAVFWAIWTMQISGRIRELRRIDDERRTRLERHNVIPIMRVGSGRSLPPG